MAAIPDDKPADSPISAIEDMTMGLSVEIDLTDNYRYFGSTKIGHITNLPNFIGKRQYTVKEDFTMENLQFSISVVGSAGVQVIVGGSGVEANLNVSSLGLIAPTCFTRNSFCKNLLGRRLFGILFVPRGSPWGLLYS